MTTGLTPLTAPTEARIREIGSAEILVGIPSYNNADTIGHVVRAVSVGLAKHFPGHRAVLVNSDGGSSDETLAIVARTVIDFQHFFISDQQSILHRIITPYYGIPGKGSAFRTIFEIARQLKARACAVVDADLRSISPEWIELLLRPIMEKGYDYVAPYYLRHKYDGTITNSLAYPLTRALYGQRIRQPIGGEFGFSGDLAAHYLDQHVWDSEVARFGIDIWMTTEAIASGARVCQSFLGAKIHNPKDPAADLSAMLMQVMGALFALMEQHQMLWSGQVGSQPVPLFGFPHEVGVEPIHVNLERMVSHYRQGLTDLEPIWRQVLASDTFTHLCDLQGTSSTDCRVPDELWVQVVYDAAIAYRKRIMPRDHLLKALTPLYLGRTASFVQATQGLTSTEAEQKVEALCHRFERMKPYLVERWQPPTLKPAAPALLHHATLDAGGTHG
ncbi:MAG: glycosyltransferase family 2 protein [Nitrospira sp.]|nr:MAG: glycosyltransferase family 2 protein [Nitrospira sp.]